MNDDAPPGLTGEQMDPNTSNPFTFWEHIYRYRFATRFVRGKRVLDIASGEGYGTAALSKAGAASIVGVDISPQVCAHAREKYGLNYVVGNAEAIPLPDHSVDVVVSFETIEHVPHPAKFLDEILRVLALNGLLVVSTPNHSVFSSPEIPANPYHVSEMNEDEFVPLLAARFDRFRLYSQFNMSAGWWAPRSFAAFNPWWIHLKGAWRLREFLRSLVCPHINGEVHENYRNRPVETILTKDKPWGAWLNPYELRRRSPRSKERPKYFIAVAEGPRQAPGN